MRKRIVTFGSTIVIATVAALPLELRSSVVMVMMLLALPVTLRLD